MRINTYELELNDDKIPCLVKEKGINYPIIGDRSLNSPKRIVDMFNDAFRLNKKAEEHIYIMAANTKMHPIGFFELSKGAVNLSLCGQREVLIRCLLCGAVNVVVLHNHPSGDVSASREDITMCKTLKAALRMVGINLIDSIIIGDDCYLSFNESGMMEK